MGGSSSCQRIVRTYAGPRTGETCYITEDGRRWTSEIWPHPTGGTQIGSGYATGYVHGNMMCPQPEPE
jgi:hypothetical protein